MNSDVMLNCVCELLWGNVRDDLNLTDAIWSEMFKEMQMQGIASLFGIKVHYYNKINRSLSNQWYVESLSCISRFESMLHEVHKIQSILNDNGIQSMCIKGVDCAINYPIPQLRSQSDIDILIHDGEFETALEVLSKNRYHISNHSGREVVLMGDNLIEIELHKYFTRMNRHSAELERIIQGSFKNLRNEVIDGVSVKVPSIHISGLIILQHINHHLETGVGLRQIIDWMMFVNKYIDDDEWNKYYSNILKKIGLYNLAIVVTKMCQEYLGLSSQITWCKNADKTLCKQLMEYILESGCFGYRISETLNYTVEQAVFTSWNLKEVIRDFQKIGCSRHPYLKKIPVLKYFLWITVIVHFMGRAIRERYGVIDLFKGIYRARKKSEFLNKIGIRRRRYEKIDME